MHSETQAVLFPNYYNTRDIQNYIKKHNLHPIKDIHQTARFKRLRLTDPKQYNRFTTEVLPNRIRLVLGWK